MQFLEEDDVVRSLEYVMRTNLSGIYNVAGDGRLPWSEVAGIAGKRTYPLPPLLTGLAVAPLARFDLLEIPPELLALMRYGRGVDNRRLKRAGFEYRYTTAGAVESFARARRLRKTIGEVQPIYKYERDVEAFFKHSPAVVRSPNHQ
jgi:UDP-glucose 4-epimerase